MEYQRFLDAHRLQRGPYELLKYEVGDFFSRHIDTRLSESHLFTCLLFVPQTDHPFVGGNLVFSDEKRTFSALVEPSKFTEPTMVIFSVNLYHEVTPIESGTRYVFKNSLVAAVPLPATIRDINREVDDLCDGGTGFGWMDSKSGDY
jgi:predicted 2-oxoglutarate/Fe(II)-dependent dioxygenase YbiX